MEPFLVVLLQQPYGLKEHIKQGPRSRCSKQLECRWTTVCFVWVINLSGDSTGPVYSSISLSPNSVDVTSSSQTIL